MRPTVEQNKNAMNGMRRPDGPYSFWEMKERAGRLNGAELRRHAGVSVDNRHKCRECFTCACAAVLSERATPSRS